MSIPSYTDWLNNTSGGVFSARSPHLKALDELIKQRRSESEIKAALENYLALEDVGRRNNTGMIDKLIDAVGLGVQDTGSDFGVTTIPDVMEPPSPIPAAPPEEVTADSSFDNEVKRLFSIEITQEQSVAPVIDIQARRDTKYNALSNKLISMNSDLMQLELEIRHKLGMSCQYFILSLQQGLEKFKELHRLDAEGKQFKITIAKGIFQAMESLPFPISAVGKLGGAIAGLAQVDTTWSAYKVELPTPDGVEGAIKEAAKKFKDLTTVNVQTDKLANHADKITEFIKAFNNYTDDVINNLTQERSAIANDSKRSKLARNVLEQLKTTSNLNDMGIIVGRQQMIIDKLVKNINKKFDPLRRMPPIEISEVRMWITVQLIADYAMTGLCDNDNISIKNMTANDLGDKSFGDSFVDFLRSNEVQILEKRETSGTSAAIYQRGRIPWDGRPYDVIAVMLFLEWFQRNINPFDLLRPNVNQSQFKKYISDYIRQLGVAMQAHEARTTFKRSKTVDNVEAVHTALGK
jgi:hypothetical protein